MKRFVTILVSAALLLSSTFASSAGEKGRYTFIVKGGFNYSGVSGVGDVKNLDLGEYSGYNIGGGLQFELPLAFSIQPEVLYYKSGTKASYDLPGYGSIDGKLYNGNIYIPVNVQWGPKLGAFRIYAQVSPFLGFAMSNRFQYTDPDDGMKTIKVLTGDTNVFMGGIGAGIGVEIWKIQVSAKYNWNFNKLFKGDIPEWVSNSFQDAKMRGLEISVGFMF